MFTMDGRYVVSGSDDASVRLWKANANEQLGTVSARESQRTEYNDALKKRYQHMPEVKRVLNKRHVPRAIKTAQQLKHTMNAAELKRTDNRRRHSKPGSEPYVAERIKNVVAVQK